jgi:hypothetical protein
VRHLLEPPELLRLNQFCCGKTLINIDYDHGDDLTLFFSDGSSVVLSTLGGIEIEELIENGAGINADQNVTGSAIAGESTADRECGKIK